MPDLNLYKIQNISFFDAPVSGGEVGAINGTLSIMYGGPNKKISIIESIMQSYSNKITKIGPSGHGQLTKMVNQLCIAGLLQGLSEGVALGKSSNLNMTKVLEAISGGAAQSLWSGELPVVSSALGYLVVGECDTGISVGGAYCGVLYWALAWEECPA